jgi:hypothetical protein
MKGRTMDKVQNCDSYKTKASWKTGVRTAAPIDTHLGPCFLYSQEAQETHNNKFMNTISK